MTPAICLQYIVRPALTMLGPRYNYRAAEVLMLAIALQESGLKHRVQVRGPARGLWQFESGGGVLGVLTHPASRDAARDVCGTLLYKPDVDEVHSALADNDLLAACFARLLLYTDARALPPIGDAGMAWDYYLRVWRPGRPHPERWAANYEAAGG